MSYDALIAALLEEGTTNRAALLAQAEAEAQRLLAEARATVTDLEERAERQVRVEQVRRRAEILGRATLAARLTRLQAQHEALASVWRRATEKAMALAGNARAERLRGLVDELLAQAPPGPLLAVIDERDHEVLAPLLQARGLAFEVQRRDDLVLGLELRGPGMRLRSSLASRLAKARPSLTVALRARLFRETAAAPQPSGDGPLTACEHG